MEGTGVRQTLTLPTVMSVVTVALDTVHPAASWETSLVGTAPSRAELVAMTL